jgi:hypothetical protein
MMLRTPVRLVLPLLACGLCVSASAQQLIGYVNTRDADITGATDVLDGQAVLTGSVSVTARDHTAPITLGRGGTVRVCQTSALHLTESRAVQVAAPLLFSLDRGSIEIQMMGTANDAIMTPDLRIAVHSGGPLDLHLRVARNGDTCVENRGPGAPTLAVSDPFGEAQYEVAAGQHVLFEHGSVHEVVDHESSPCGCPDDKGMSIADALLASGGAKSAAPQPAAAPPVSAAVAPAPVAAAPAAAIQTSPDDAAALKAPGETAAQTAIRAAEQHPFPAAISEGLAPTAEVPQAPPGQVHAQVTDTLSYNAAVSAQPAGPVSAPPAAAAPAAPVPVPAKPANNDLVHIVGRFFKRLFGG